MVAFRRGERGILYQWESGTISSASHSAHSGDGTRTSQARPTLLISQMMIQDEVELPPAQARDGQCGEGVVVVVPPFAEADDADEEVVGALVAAV